MDTLPKALTFCISVDEAGACLEAKFSEIFLLISEHTATENSKVVSKVKEYVNSHFSEHIVLEDIAAKVYLNPAYLSSLFKQKTGETFTYYLTDVRMRHAKKLLRDVRYTVAEVSGLTGYKDPKHFRKVFKKAVGIKPLEYRKLSATDPVAGQP